jgi:hypothetical protein
MEPTQNILAFQTITTMLNVLQDGPTSHKPSAFLRNTGQSKAQELRTLNAIATLLVRRNEVNSVVLTAEENRADAISIGVVCINQDPFNVTLISPIPVMQIHCHHQPTER